MEEKKTIATLTKKAAEKIKEFIAKDPESKGKTLRINVAGGGCSGFQYEFSLDIFKEGDQAIKEDGAEVLINPSTASIIQGSIIDYVDSFQGAGFVVENPNATTSCGCGQSFSV